MNQFLYAKEVKKWQLVLDIFSLFIPGKSPKLLFVLICTIQYPGTVTARLLFLTMISRSTRRKDHDVCIVLDRLPRPVHEKAGVSVLQTQSKVLRVVVSQSGTSDLH